MRVNTALLLLAAAVAALALVDARVSRPAIDKHAIERINQAGTSWTAGVNEYFSEWTHDTLKNSMGVKRKAKSESTLPAMRYPAKVTQALPQTFDARTQWPTCIGPVLNQAECGSCWAFGAAEAISDRMCISQGANGTFLQLAPLDLVTCDGGIFGNSGCQGGDPESAWDYAKTYGLVTEACLPYGTAEGGPIPTCPPASQPCMPNTFVPTPACTKKCANGNSYSGDKHKIQSVYTVSGTQSIMAEIYKNGPVEAAFTVYEDFVNYKSGVYQYTSGEELGGHAVKIIGWGIENDLEYWLVQNSWTTTWGDGGYFMIRRGVDECGIEDDIVAGTA